MAFKKFRKMKECDSYGCNYKSTLSIILKGDWLKETGFEIGSLIQVECENGKTDYHSERRGNSGVCTALWCVFLCS